MQSEGTSPSAEQISQQNRLFYAKQRLKYKHLFNDLEYNAKELPALVTTYNGYMQIHKRKAAQNPTATTEYFSSPLLSDLKEKRNNMFSDEIIEKMVKNYELNEYGSEVDWKAIASNGIDLSRTKFSGTGPA